MLGRRESKVLKLINQHLELIIKVVDELEMLVNLVFDDGPMAIFESKVSTISTYESLADDIYLEAVVEICKGAFFSGLREDFIRLFETMDDIADFAKGSSQILDRNRTNRPFLGKIHDDPEMSFRVFVEKIANSLLSFKQAVACLRIDVNALVEKCIEVKGWEEEADEIKSKLVDRIFARRSEIDTLALLELKDLVLTLDEIADAVERSSEVLIIIAAKARA